jgi:nitrous oxide reductase accessory protein NosL
MMVDSKATTAWPEASASRTSSWITKNSVAVFIISNQNARIAGFMDTFAYLSMKKHRIMRKLLIFLALSLASCQGGSSSTQKKDPLDGAMDCRNCGMPTQEYPRWQAKALVQGEARFFCSPKCLVMWQRGQEARPDTAWVVDYYEVARLRADTAYYVLGSDVLGPMGHDLVPLATEAAAREFLRDHQGKAVLRYESLDSAVAAGL